jgi:hypothetical protein
MRPAAQDFPHRAFCITVIIGPLSDARPAQKIQPPPDAEGVSKGFTVLRLIFQLDISVTLFMLCLLFILWRNLLRSSSPFLRVRFKKDAVIFRKVIFNQLKQYKLDSYARKRQKGTRVTF